MPFDEHERLITALLAGWWAVMEIEDHIHSSREKGECGDLPTDQEIEAQQGAPVPFSSKQEVSVPSRTPKGPTVPEESQREVPVLSRNLKGATVPDRSEHEAPVPPLRQKLKILENMRQYLTRKSILIPLPLRQPMGWPIPAAAHEQAPVPVVSPEEAPVLARTLQGATAANGS